MPTYRIKEGRLGRSSLLDILPWQMPYKYWLKAYLASLGKPYVFDLSKNLRVSTQLHALTSKQVQHYLVYLCELSCMDT